MSAHHMVFPYKARRLEIARELTKISTTPALETQVGTSSNNSAPHMTANTNSP